MTAPLINDAIMLSPLLWTLVAIQIAMGGFDVVFHHELTERLAWKENAAHELRLHAWRNLFYAVLFLTFAWTQPQGWLAIALIAVLSVVRRGKGRLPQGHGAETEAGKPEEHS